MKIMINHAAETENVLIRNIASVYRLLSYIESRYRDISSIRLLGDNEVGAWAGDVSNIANVMKLGPLDGDDHTSYAFLYLHRREDGFWALSTNRIQAGDTLWIRQSSTFAFYSALEVRVIGEFTDVKWNKPAVSYHVPADVKRAAENPKNVLTSMEELHELIPGDYNKWLLRTLSMLAGEFDIQRAIPL